MTTLKSDLKDKREKYQEYIQQTKEIVDAHEAGEISAEEANKRFNALRNPLS